VDLYGKTAILEVSQQEYKKWNIAYRERNSPLVSTVKIAMMKSLTVSVGFELL